MRELCEAGKTDEAMAAMRDRAVAASDAILKALAELKVLQRARVDQASGLRRRGGSLGPWRCGRC